MAEEPTHFGRAGEFFAMSELLLRGWNVAVPVVDVGDDVFVIDDLGRNDVRKSSTWVIAGCSDRALSQSRGYRLT